MRPALVLTWFALAACRSPRIEPPDAGPACPDRISTAEIDAARKALEAYGIGEHEVAIGDGGCWRLAERRSINGPRAWDLYAVTPRGPRLRLHVEPGFRDVDPELAARHLESPTTWVLGNDWPEYAERIETCRERDGGDLDCFGAAIH